jgi:CRISPR-associated protein (TIGR02710 family)
MLFAIKANIPQLLESKEVSPEEVLVDYTGGTKPMSAALVLATIEKFNNFSYIGGKEREEDGLGIVIDGRERQVYLNNPWTGLGIREIEKAKFLWDNYLFEATYEVLKTVWDVVPQRLEFKTVATVSEAMAARHRLDFNSAMIKLFEALKEITKYYPENKNADFIEFVNKSLEICKICNEANTDESDVLLKELIDNCIRTAKQKRFEDASARLYRAAEHRCKSG